MFTENPTAISWAGMSVDSQVLQGEKSSHAKIAKYDLFSLSNEERSFPDSFAELFFGVKWPCYCFDAHHNG